MPEFVYLENLQLTVIIARKCERDLGESVNNQTPPDAKMLVNLVRAWHKSLTLVWRLFSHPRVSMITKTIPVAAFLYWLNPIDPLPPPLNMTPIDDLTAVLLGLKLFVELSPPDLVAAIRHEIEYGKPLDDEVIDASYRVIDDD